MKRLFTIAFALLIALSASAQNYVNLGYGNCFDKWGFGDDEENSNSSEFFLGYSHNFNIKGNFGVEPGVNYLFNFNSDLAEGFGTKNFYHGLQIPVLFNYQFAPVGDISFKVLAGPSASFGISDKTSTFALGEKGYTINNYGDDGSYSRLGIAAAFGVSAEWRETLRLKIGFDYGLRDIYKPEKLSLRQDNISISIGYIF